MSRVLEEAAAAGPIPALWTLDALSGEAEAHSPRVALAEARVRSAEAAVRAADVGTNPTFSANAQTAVGRAGSADAWTVTAEVDIPLPVAGARDHRVEAAQREVAAARADVVVERRAVRDGVRDAYLTAAFARRQAAAAHEEALGREALAALARARLEAGEGTQAEWLAARVAALTAAAEAGGADADAESAVVALATAVGRSRAALGEQATLEDRWLDQAPTAGGACPLEQRPDVLAAELWRQVAVARWQAEEAAAGPEVHLLPGYAYDQGENKVGLGAAVPLPVADRREGPIAVARAAVAEAEAQLRLVAVAATTQRDEAQAALSGGLAALAATGQTVQAEEVAVASEERALAAGQSDRAALQGERLLLAVARRLRLDALKRAWLARAALDAACAPEVP